MMKNSYNSNYCATPVGEVTFDVQASTKKYSKKPPKPKKSKTQNTSSGIAHWIGVLFAVAFVRAMFEFFK